jgi:hypothetical protein
MRRPAKALYPRLRNFSEALAYYQSIKPLRGHKDSSIRPLAPDRRQLDAWRMFPTNLGIVCSHWNSPVITYYRDGRVHIATPPQGSASVAVLAAVAPVDTVKWDYRKDGLVVRANGVRYTCAADDPEGIWLPPTA